MDSFPMVSLMTMLAAAKFCSQILTWRVCSLDRDVQKIRAIQKIDPTKQPPKSLVLK